MISTIDLDAITTTKPTRQVVKMMEQAGLAPHLPKHGPAAYRGAVSIVFDEGGKHGVFGVVYVGARTGKILRASITHGNHADTKHLTGHFEVRQAVSSLVAIKRAIKAAA